MNKKPLSPLAAAFGAAFLASAAFAPIASADAGFAAKPLPAGYNLAAAETEGKCGEGKCGEGKCGDKKAEGEGKCGGDKKAEGEGKCGEGKCGDDKKAEKADGEGKCGEGKCGH